MITKRRIKRFAPILSILVLSLIAWGFGLDRYFDFELLKSHQRALDGYIERNYLLSLAIYGALYIFLVVLSVPVVFFMTVAGGFLFGQWVGAFIAVISATIGAFLLFLSAKVASSGLLAKTHENVIKKMQKGFQENSLLYLLSLRLFPFVPFALVNLAAGIFQVPLQTFIIGTFFGIIPGDLVYASIGVALRGVARESELFPQILFRPKIVLPLIGLVVLSLLPVLYRYLKKKPH
jgi:uncharacterized membrane protein YdjX (TVP38/TMEM64 family)